MCPLCGTRRNHPHNSRFLLKKILFQCVSYGLRGERRGSFLSHFVHHHARLQGLEDHAERLRGFLVDKHSALQDTRAIDVEWTWSGKNRGATAPRMTRCTMLSLSSSSARPRVGWKHRASSTPCTRWERPRANAWTVWSRTCSSRVAQTKK